MTTPQLGGAAIATKYDAPLVTDRTVLVNEPSPSAEHVNRLLNSTVPPELHALAWLEPFTNSSDHGRWDPGGVVATMPLSSPLGLPPEALTPKSSTVRTFLSKDPRRTVKIRSV